MPNPDEIRLARQALLKKEIRPLQSKRERLYQWLKKVYERWSWWLLLLLGLILFITFYKDSGVQQCRMSLSLEKCIFLGKSAWEWLELLIAPALLAIGGLIVDQYFKTRDEKQEEQAKKLSKDRIFQESLKDYFDEVTKLFLDPSWPDDLSQVDNGEVEKRLVAIARAKTITFIRELDGERNSSIIRFLLESETFELL